MSNMDKSVQHRSVLSLPVQVQQDTPKGTFVTATGLAFVKDATFLGEAAMPLGVTEHNAVEGEMVAVTVLGTASVNLANFNINSDVVSVGMVLVTDYVVTEVGALSSYVDSGGIRIMGIVLSESSPTGHTEMLLR